MWTVPGLPLWNTSLPSVTGTVTWLAMVSPLVKFRFEAVGRLSPCGYTVRYPAAVGAVTVTLATTAVMSAAGVPSMLGTGRTTSLPDATGVVVVTPVALRVSSSRVGVTGV